MKVALIPKAKKTDGDRGGASKKRLGLTNLFMVKWVVVRISSDE